MYALHIEWLDGANKGKREKHILRNVEADKYLAAGVGAIMKPKRTSFRILALIGDASNSVS